MRKLATLIAISALLIITAGALWISNGTTNGRSGWRYHLSTSAGSSALSKKAGTPSSSHAHCALQVPPRVHRSGSTRPSTRVKRPTTNRHQASWKLQSRSLTASAKSSPRCAINAISSTALVGNLAAAMATLTKQGMVSVMGTSPSTTVAKSDAPPKGVISLVSAATDSVSATTTAPTTPSPSSDTLPMSSPTGLCIINAESRGDPNAYNPGPPPDWGKYQFQATTWASAEALLPADEQDTWGSAPEALQDDAFNAYVNAYGYGAWTPYDGC